MTRIRLLLVLVFVALPLLASHVAALRASGSRVYDAHALPGRLAGFQLVSEQPLELDVESMLAPESYSMRLYTDEHGSAIWIYFAAYSGTGTSGAHDPTVCYPAQGWDADAAQDRELVLSDGNRIAVKRLRATLGGREEQVLYWFQPADRWPTSAPMEPLLRILDRLAGRPQYGFVRLSVQVSKPGAEERRRADARLTEVALALAPAVRQVASAGR